VVEKGPELAGFLYDRLVSETADPWFGFLRPGNPVSRQRRPRQRLGSKGGAIAPEAQASGAGGTIRQAGRRGGLLPCHRRILDGDRFKSLLGDAKGHGSSFNIASPGQERAIGTDLFQQPSTDSLSTALRTASPVTFAGRSTPQSLRREAYDDDDFEA